MSDINDIISPDALKGVDALYDKLGKVVEQLDRAAQSSASLDTTMSKMAGAATQAGASMTDVNNKTKEAQQINVQYRNTSEEIVAAKLRFARANKQQRDELGALIVLEDKEAGTLEKLAARNKLLREEQRKLNLETKEGVKRNKEINKEINANTAFVKNNSDALVKQKMNIGNYQSALSALPGPIGIVITSVQAMTKVFVMNPIGAVIMAIVAAVILLAKVFKSTDSGATLFAARFEQIKAIIDVVRQRIVKITEAIGHIFKGEWKEAGEAFKESVRGAGEQLREATKAAYDYIYALDAIEDAENNYVSQSAETRNKIARLEYSAQDRSKSFAERKKALQDAISLGEEELAAQREFARKRLEAEITYIAGKNNLAEQEVLAFIKMTDAEQAQADEAVRTARNNNEEKFKEIEQFYAAWLDLDTRFYEENKRNISRLSGFEEQERKQRIDAETKAAEEIQKRKEIIEKAEYDVSKQMYKEAQNIKADAGTDWLETYQDIIDEEIKATEDLVDKDIDAWMRDYEARKQMEQDLAALKIEVLNSAFEFGSALIDRQSAKLEAAYKREVAAAGDNADAKEKIDEKYDKKRKQLQRKQAVADKVQALFNIGIDVAKGIASALAKTVTIPLIPWIAAMGAIQAATVLATPLPQYAKGTKSSKGGLAVVGEKGRELMIDPSGRVSLTGDTAHLTMLKPGTKIIPSDETSAIMRAAAVSRRSTIEDTIKSGNRDIVEAIRRQRIEIAATTGKSITVREGNQWREYFGRHLQ